MENRDDKGRFTAGNSGRPRGSRNKATDVIREKFQTFLEKNLDSLQEDFDELEPRERFDVIFKLSKFVLPTLKAIEFGNILDELTESDFEELIHRLKNQHLN